MEVKSVSKIRSLYGMSVAPFKVKVKVVTLLKKVVGKDELL
jgi:hypothetical protein